MHNQINEAKQKLPELEEIKNIANEAFQKSENALNTIKEEQIKLEPIFKKVSELDTKISEKEKLLQPILKVISELEKSKNEIFITLETQNADLKKSQKLLIEKENWATENKKYEELVSNYTAIENENQLLVASSSEIKKQNSEIAELQKDLNLKKSNAKKAEEDYKGKENNLVAKTKELETQKLALVKLLEGKELSVHQLEKENISNFCIQIKYLIEIENAILTNQKEINDFDKKIKQYKKLDIANLEKIETDKKIITNLENQINLLEENIKLTKTIQSLDEHRQNLKDGEECPLCGALEHPFAKGNIPKIGEKEKELANLKKQFQDITKTIHQNEKNYTRSVSDKENALKNKAKEEKTLSDNLIKQIEKLSEIKNINPNFSLPKGEKRIEKLEEILTTTKENVKAINLLITKVTSCEKELSNLHDKEIPKLQEEKQKADKLKTDALTAQKLAEQILKTKQEIADSIQEKHIVENVAFLNKLKNYAVENMEALKKCLDTWNENQKQTVELIDKIKTLSSNIAINNKELENQTNSLKEKQKDQQNIEIEKQKSSNEREEIFAKKSVEEEENRLKKLLKNAETTKANAEKCKTDTNTELEKYKAIVTDKEKELLKTEEEKITEKTTDELQSELDKYKIKSDEFSQKIGAHRQRLNFNSENLKNCGNKLKEKEKQQAVCGKWGNLNELIGSVDGKKYRNFAQALTFEHLIGLSNRQLQKMSDRYILKRTGDSSNPFELSVIDKFQNDEERTAQNLSGGEKFIVSLSLALGLSNMASKNMRIDTMFIDEGFGTLDADYLDVALNALSNLQSEGKIIGIISHLTELKERIATHVEVVSYCNGHSKIQITNEQH